MDHYQNGISPNWPSIAKLHLNTAQAAAHEAMRSPVFIIHSNLRHIQTKSEPCEAPHERMLEIFI